MRIKQLCVWCVCVVCVCGVCVWCVCVWCVCGCATVFETTPWYHGVHIGNLGALRDTLLVYICPVV